MMDTFADIPLRLKRECHRFLSIACKFMKILGAREVDVRLILQTYNPDTTKFINYLTIHSNTRTFPYDFVHQLPQLLRLVNFNSDTSYEIEMINKQLVSVSTTSIHNQPHVVKWYSVRKCCFFLFYSYQRWLPAASYYFDPNLSSCVLEMDSKGPREISTRSSSQECVPED